MKGDEGRTEKISVEAFWFRATSTNFHGRSTACDCDPVGSASQQCAVYGGQCSCRPGVTGLYCDQCLPNHYGFSASGCAREYENTRGEGRGGRT